MKIMISLNKDTLNDTMPLSDAYLIGIDGLSVNMGEYLSLDDVKKIIPILKENNKEVFINLNKNMFSKDLNVLEQTLIELDNFDIDGICFYDVAVISLVKKHNLKTPLVWHQEHFTTNFLTINTWYNDGVESCFLANEITKEEIEEIKNNTKSKLIMQVFGYVPIFFSKRPMITNYKKYFKLDNNSTIYTILKDNKEYLMKEYKEGLEVYYPSVLNTGNIIDVDYIYLNSFMIDNFLEVLSDYKSKGSTDLYDKELGFLSIKTVYRVKDL